MASRHLSGFGGLSAVLATLFLAGPGQAEAGPDEMRYGQVRQTSAEALARAPLRLPIPAGGDLDLEGCPEVRHLRAQGYVTIQPDLSLRLTANRNRRRIDVRVESACDAVLLVNEPDGRWRWDDDGNPESALDPAISADRARTGWWDVWVGRFGDPEPCRAQLIVSAGPPGRRGTSAEAQPPGFRTSGFSK